MKSVLRYAVACAVASVVFASPALASDQPAKPSPEPGRSPALENQQNKMKKCNEEAGKKALKGDERRAFMSACLKA